jgi:hypothetical protein
VLPRDMYILSIFAFKLWRVTVKVQAFSDYFCLSLSLSVT